MGGRASKAGGPRVARRCGPSRRRKEGCVEAGRAVLMITHDVGVVIDLGHRRRRVTGLVRLILPVPEVGLELRAGP